MNEFLLKPYHRQVPSNPFAHAMEDALPKGGGQVTMDTASKPMVARVTKPPSKAVESVWRVA